MEAKETPDNGAGTPLPAESSADVSGGADCTSISVGGVTVSGSGSPADAMIAIYDGAVAATSHIIETVVKSTS